MSEENFLSGDLKSDPSSEFSLSNTLIIFISSTFEDTSFEQNALLKDAFPKLKYFCKQNDFHFQVVSMRWGVRNKSSNDHLTSELCMHLLEKCKKDSAGIAYATIQSHRYGYRPFPSIIEKGLFESLKIFEYQVLGMTQIHDSLLDSPYWKLDEACFPQVYRLQPIDSLPGLEKYMINDLEKAKMKQDETIRKDLLLAQKEAGSKWWSIFAKMQLILRSCADRAHSAGLISKEERRPFFISVTHDEVDRGLLENPNRRAQCLYFERTITGIDQEGLQSSDPINAGTAATYKDATWAPWGTAPRVKDEETEKLEELLKADLRSHQDLDPACIFLHSVPWVSSDPSSDPSYHPLDKKQVKEPIPWQNYIQLFCDQFISSLERSLSNLKPRPDPLLQEVLHHRSLVLNKIQSLGFDRSSILERIQLYLAPRSNLNDDPHDNRPFFLHGTSGSGKSWIMSHAIFAAREAHPDAHIVYRLLGTSRSSSDVLELIQSLSRQIHFRNPPSWSSIPGDWVEAKEWFSSGKVFQNISSERPLFIFLDSLDQLSPLFGPLKNLGGWFPGLKKECPLPTNVRVVCSTLPFEQGIDLLSQLRNSSRIEDNLLEVPLFTKEEAASSIPSMYDNLPFKGVICPTRPVLVKGTEDFLSDLCSRHSSALFLTVALELVSHWPSYVDDSQRSELMIAADKEGVQGLIALLFRQLEFKHGRLLVGKVLGCMTYCRDGLGREELEDLVSLDEEVLEDVFEWWEPPVRRCPPLLVDRIMFDLDQFVVERGSMGGGVVWGWYHRQFWEVAKSRYGSTETDRDAIYYSISSYFDSDLPTTPLNPTRKAREVDNQILSLSPCTPTMIPTTGLNVRKLSVLLDSLLKGNVECQLRLGHLLTNDISFLMGAMEAGLYQELRVTYQSLHSKLLQTLISVNTDNPPPLSIPLPHLLNDIKYMSKLMGLCSGVWSHSNDLLRSSTQLPYQIWFRMDRSLHHSGNSLLSQCEQWMRSDPSSISRIPLNRLLTQVDSHLEITVNHSLNVTCVCSLPDGRLASGSWDKTIRVWDLSSGECVRVLQGHIYGVTCVCSLSDNYLASGSWDKTVRLWDLSSGECAIAFEGHTEYVTSVCSLSDSRLASCSWDQKIRIWDLSSGEFSSILEGHTYGVNSVCSVSRDQLASASEDKSIRIWDLVSGKCIQILLGHLHPVTSVCSLSDGRLASGSWDHTVRVWDLFSGQCIQVLGGHSDTVSSVCSLSDGRLASCSKDKTVRVWDMVSGNHSLNKVSFTFQGHTDSVTGLCFLSDGRLATSSDDKTVRVWHFSSEEKMNVNVLDGHTQTVTCVCSLPQNRLASGSEDKTIRIWDLLTGECVFVLQGHYQEITCVSLRPDGLLTSYSNDETVRLWDLSIGCCVRCLREETVFESGSTCCSLSDGRLATAIGNRIHIEGIIATSDENNEQYQRHFDPVTCTCLLSDGLLASGSNDNSVRIWDLASGECVRVLEGHTDNVRCVCSLPEGRLASGTWDGMLCVWDVASAECIMVLLGHCGPIQTFCLLPNDLLASGSNDHSIRVWDISTRNCVQLLQGHLKGIISICSLSFDRLASSSNDSSVRIWDLISGKCLHVLEGHAYPVTCVCSLPDGRLASGSWDQKIRIWDLASGECVQVLEKHTDPVIQLFSLSDGVMVSGSNNGTAIIWDTTTGDRIRAVQSFASIFVIRYIYSLASKFDLIQKDLKCKTDSVDVQNQNNSRDFLIDSLLKSVELIGSELNSFDGHTLLPQFTQIAPLTSNSNNSSTDISISVVLSNYHLSFWTLQLPDLFPSIDLHPSTNSLSNKLTQSSSPLPTSFTQSQLLPKLSKRKTSLIPNLTQKIIRLDLDPSAMGLKMKEAPRNKELLMENHEIQSSNSTSLSLFYQLPISILKHVLSNYLTVIEISNLDSITTSKKERNILHSILNFNLSHTRFFVSSNPNRPLSEFPHCTFVHFQEYFDWKTHRKIKTQGMMSIMKCSASNRWSAGETENEIYFRPRTPIGAWHSIRPFEWIRGDFIPFTLGSSSSIVLESVRFHRYNEGNCYYNGRNPWFARVIGIYEDESIHKLSEQAINWISDETTEASFPVHEINLPNKRLQAVRIVLRNRYPNCNTPPGHQHAYNGNKITLYGVEYIGYET